MSFSAIAWDIDGTLIDSEPLHHEALAAACRLWGADLSDLPDQAFRGIDMGEVWRRISPRLPPGTAQAAWLAAVNDYYAGHPGRLVAIAQAVPTMRALAARGVRQVCVSNSCRRIVDANLAALGVAELLEFSLSLDDVPAGKPDPAPYLAACARLALPPARVMAVEDSRAGAASARAAGLYVVGFLGSGGDFGAVDRVTGDLSSLPALFPAAPA